MNLEEISAALDDEGINYIVVEASQEPKEKWTLYSGEEGNEEASFKKVINTTEKGIIKALNRETKGGDRWAFARDEDGRRYVVDKPRGGSSELVELM